MAKEEDLEQFAQVKETDEYDTESVDVEDLTDKLKAASILLKNNAVLFEFLSRDFIKAISKREKLIMIRQIDKIYDFTEKTDSALEDLEGDF